MPSPLTEYSPEWETFEAETEASELAASDRREIIDEATELDLAGELLAVSNELELDQFLGDLIRTVGRAVGSAVRSPLGQAIGSRLKSAIRTALPLAGGALGTFAGGPLGASIGSGLASMAGRAFGLELEGLSPEDVAVHLSRQICTAIQRQSFAWSLQDVDTRPVLEPMLHRAIK